MIKWRTGGYGKNLIERVEIEKETKKTVWVRSTWYGGTKTEVRQERKDTGYHQYHDTWDDAKAYLMEQANADKANARRKLDMAISHIDLVSKLTKPEDAE